MRIWHQGFAAAIDDAWWEEALMIGFVPNASAYVSERAGALCVRVIDIGPIPEPRRKLGVIREDETEGRTARERVLYILGRIKEGQPIEPITVRLGSSFRYDLVHGVHRLHLSIASGFTHIPAILRDPPE